ncbi:MAG: DNA polymerase III subunit chi [Gallionella sp.]|nr:DNA polymerase III subunit chi [Gallionella sp.]MDD4946205.1 DNA polymerase III subunit chi [Gallionella sp.]MDD5613365.1 DNA polymerase III subunit chi [Gallionella sp.]
MTRIDFYTGSPDKLRTVCQLSHKAMQNGLKTVISLPDAASYGALDRLLWHFPDTAFIPHCSSDAESAAQTPVLLSHGKDRFPHHDLLISLHDQCVPYFSRFERVIEIIGTHAEDSRLGRERYKFYRDRGYELRHFDLSGEQQT